MTRTRAYLMFAEMFARYVEYAASIAREFGFRIPAEYDVATSAMNTRSQFVVEYRLRLNDVTHEVVVRFPNPDEGISRYQRDHAALVEKMQHACAELVLKYAQAHGLEPTKDEVARLDRAGVFNDPEVDRRASRITRTAIYDSVKTRRVR